ncbi:MAG: hypothetical protein DWQ44_09010 [Bacteroidetes bacterium]|nr:MAG: hypothetical protein DWQ33_02765 [Bacteroidota bacterium]REK06429.1 MAG: hypothetical protein DWQ39_02800 [Bacteroidota bacterium]REK33195.1 MAG: hypothetical protein DWQ44_09010 [Bacteroidota bacterium]REK47032.1 MAG: hypothetical protein DWQ48_13345 [Bacteroidota bacterium]
MTDKKTTEEDLIPAELRNLDVLMRCVADGDNYKIDLGIVRSILFPGASADEDGNTFLNGATLVKLNGATAQNCTFIGGKVILDGSAWTGCTVIQSSDSTLEADDEVQTGKSYTEGLGSTFVKVLALNNTGTFSDPNINIPTKCKYVGKFQVVNGAESQKQISATTILNAPDKIPFALICDDDHVATYNSSLIITMQGLGDINTNLVLNDLLTTEVFGGELSLRFPGERILLRRTPQGHFVVENHNKIQFPA